MPYGVKPGTQQLAITSITMLTNLINEWTRNEALEPTAVDTSPLLSLVTTRIISGDYSSTVAKSNESCRYCCMVAKCTAATTTTTTTTTITYARWVVASCQ